MSENVAQKLIKAHWVNGSMTPAEVIGLRIDQTLTQDATGTLVMLEFEAMGIPRVKTELSAQYVDHNLLQIDNKNAEDHLFLQSASKKFGLWFSPAGNGVSHPVHMERFGIPGKTLLGSDSHTPAAGSLGMLAIGAGGLEVALAMAGEPFYTKMPRIWGVRLTGKLPPWVSAKDVILEMLRRHDVDGGVGKIIEYYGPGLESLSAMDRHVIANVGAELGATSTVFPSDRQVQAFLRQQGREADWVELRADPDASYDDHEEIDLSSLEPLIACPSSPGNVVPVREVAGHEVFQSYVGSSANPALRDFAVAALMVEGRRIHERVSFDVNPTSRQILENLATMGHLGKLIGSGARIHQAGCNGCIGMGQAPATNHISLRTTPRNFPGRSGTKEDQVYLCSPETATAAALTGVITDPRTLNQSHPQFKEPEHITVLTNYLVPPAKVDSDLELIKGPNIKALPDFDPLLETFQGPILLRMGDDVSTDEILPAGAKVLPFRSNIPEISKFAFSQIDDSFYQRVAEYSENGFAVVGGENYGQGSSREHAALAPRYLGLRIVLAKSFARIHWQNLVNFGVLPLTFQDSEETDMFKQDDIIEIGDLRRKLEKGQEIEVRNQTQGTSAIMEHGLSARQIEMILEGGLINVMKKKKGTTKKGDDS